MKSRSYVLIAPVCVSSIILSVSSFLCARPSLAADSSASGNEAQLVEVVITAQKRAENLQTVPISAQVVSGESLARENLNSLAALSNSVPALQVSLGAPSNDIYIRGIGSGLNKTFDQSVGIFIDDVYHGRSRGTSATFLDLERIEVLKGPQSTYFGNNAIAGALSIVTTKPNTELSGHVRALYGNFDQYAVEGAVGGPLTDVLSGRVAATFNGNNGWIRNVGTERDEPQERSSAARVSLLFQPLEQLDATLKIEGSKERNKGNWGAAMTRCPPPPPFTTPSLCTVALGLNQPIGLDGRRNSDNGQGTELETYEGVLTVSYRLENNTLTSVSGYQHYDFSFDLDADITPRWLLALSSPEEFKQFSQEFRIVSSADRRFEYIAGLYFQTDRLNYELRANAPSVNPVISSVPSLAALVPYLPLGQSTNYSQPEEVYSAFGELSWNANDKTKLTVGLRATRNEKSFDRNVYFGTAPSPYEPLAALPIALQPLASAVFGTPANTIGADRKDDALMPSAKIQYRLNPEAMVYASYTRGFKAGGFNGTGSSGVAAELAFDPEFVNAYEVGIKGQWLGNTLLTNLDVFRSDYRDLQVAVSRNNSAGTPLTVISNAGASRSQGVELETQWVASQNLRFAANATYLHARFVTYRNVGPTPLQIRNGIATQDLSDTPPPFAPTWSGNIVATFSAPVADTYRFIAELSPYLTSRYLLSGNGNGDPIIAQGGYARLDARISLASADDRWSVDLLGKNLTDRTILAFGTNVQNSGTYAFGTAMPRSVAVQGRYNW